MNDGLIEAKWEPSESGSRVDPMIRGGDGAASGSRGIPVEIVTSLVLAGRLSTGGIAVYCMK